MKQLPHDLNAEAAVLSAMMNDKVCVPVAFEALREEHFYDINHKRIYKLMMQLFDENISIDVITLANQVEQKKYNIKLDYLNELSDVVLTGANIKNHIRIILDKFYTRELILQADKIKSECYNQDSAPAEILDRAKKSILSIGIENDNTVHRTEDIVIKTLQTIQKNCERDEGFGVKTGIPNLDSILGIIKPYHYVLISAASKVGKTIMACQIAWHNAFVRKKNVVYFAYEMSYDELFMREISRQTRISFEKLENGWLSPEDHDVIAAVTGRLSKANIIIDDKPGQSAEEIRSKLMMWQNEMKIDLAIVDYIQMGKMHKAEKRYEALTEYSKDLKAIGKDLNIAIITTVQVNDKGELSEAKNMIQPADKRFHITRPDIQKHKCVYIDGIKYEPPLENFAILEVTENRAGKVGKVKAEFNGDNQEFVEWSETY